MEGTTNTRPAINPGGGDNKQPKPSVSTGQKSAGAGKPDSEALSHIDDSQDNTERTDCIFPPGRRLSTPFPFGTLQKLFIRRHSNPSESWSGTPLPSRSLNPDTKEVRTFIPQPTLQTIPPSPKRLILPWSSRTEPDFPCSPEGAMYQQSARRRSSEQEITSTSSRSSTPDSLCNYLEVKLNLRRSSTPATLTNPISEGNRTPPEEKDYSADLPTVCGLEDVLNYPGQGIPGQHLEALLETNKVYRCIISIRPFAKIATSLCLAGKKSKGLRYKLKSSGWGPHAALLPLKQMYSKLFGAPKKVIDKFQTYADELKDEAVQLCLTSDRLEELQKMTLPESDTPILENVRTVDQGLLLFEARPTPMADPIQFKGKPLENGTFAIEVLEDGEFVPLKVIDLIPDYDLGFIFIPMDKVDLAKRDKVPYPDVTPRFTWERLEKHENRPRSSSIGSSDAFRRMKEKVSSMKSFLKDMDQSVGNISPRDKQYLSALNSTVGRTSKNKMFHHGADNFNPVSDPETNFPLTVIVPWPVNGLKDNFYIIEDSHQLTAFIKVMKDNDYYAPANPLWEEEKKVRSSSFSRYSRKTGEPMRKPRDH